MGEQHYFPKVVGTVNGTHLGHAFMPSLHGEEHGNLGMLLLQ
jgi:hypothetical protein